MGGVQLFCHAINRKWKEKKSAPKEDCRIKHREKCCPYHLWINFSIMFLEDERGRGELNVGGDKGIENRFRRANHLPVFSYNLPREQFWIRWACEWPQQLAPLVATLKWSAEKVQVVNIQCSHSTIKEHLALLAKNFNGGFSLVSTVIYKRERRLWGQRSHWVCGWGEAVINNHFLFIEVVKILIVE